MHRVEPTAPTAEDLRHSAASLRSKATGTTRRSHAA